jgi:arginyl-tRNA synthetase
LKKQEIENLIEIPPNLELGDYAFPCFCFIKKKRKKAPNILAENFAKDLQKKLPKEFEKIEANATSTSI